MGFFYSQLFVRPSYPNRSFSGETVIVTGSNTGLGKEAARHCARLGATKIILAVRNLKAGEEAKKDIEATTECGANVLEVWSLDLSKYDSVKEFAKRANQLPRIDVLLENAGVAGLGAEVEGHERMIAINVISTFLLGLMVLPKLKETAKKFNVNPRLVIVCSEVHGHTEFPEWKEPNTFVALDDKSKIRESDRYPISKLLEVLPIREIAPKIESSGVILNYLNPGMCHSELGRDASFMFQVFKFFMARSTEVGSRTLVAAASAGPESHGKYMYDGVVNDGALSDFVKSADGKKAQKKVWKELADILEKIQPGVTENLS